MARMGAVASMRGRLLVRGLGAGRREKEESEAAAAAGAHTAAAPLTLPTVRPVERRHSPLLSMGKRDRAGAGGDPAEPTPRHPPGTTPPPNPLNALATTALAAAGDPETLTRGAGGGSPSRAAPRGAERAPTPAATAPPRAAEREPAPATPTAGRGTRGAVLPAGVAALKAEADLVAAGKMPPGWRGAERTSWRARVSRARTVATLDVAASDLQRWIAASEGGGGGGGRASADPGAPPAAAAGGGDARVAALEARVTWLETSLAAVAEAGRGQFEALADAVSARGGRGNGAGGDAGGEG